MSKLKLSLLGQPEFKIDGRAITNNIANKGQALMAYLAVTRQAHSRETLAGLLWSDMGEEKARRNLRVTLTKLRNFFAEHLVIQWRTVAFNLESDYWLDVQVFEEAVQQPQPPAAQLKAAVDLYRGAFLAGLSLRDAPLFEEWERPCRERLRQIAIDALYRLALHHTQQKHYAAGIEDLGRLLALEPWLEEAHRQLMLLLALSGQRSAALAQYELCRSVLHEELGVELSDATHELYQRILHKEIQEDLAATAVWPVAASIRKWTPPFQAPAPVRHYVGREAVQAEISQQLRTADGTIHALVGMGGVGKTALATQIVHDVQDSFVDGVLWANATTGEPMAILESWAQLYGFDFAQVSDLKTMAAAFQGVLADRQVLIVLDDVVSVSRIRPLLPTHKHVQVLMTTRDQDLAYALNAHTWRLKELSPANGRLLLTRILGEKRVEAEPKAANEICDLLHNLPLAVEITAQRLKSRPQRRLADFAARLRDEKQRLSELKLSDREVRASFALSYASLDTRLRHIFTLMGLFGGRSFTAVALASITGQDRYEVEDRIFTLVALSLAQEEGEARYSQHPLLADFAREKLEDEREAYGRFAAYYLDFARQYQHNYESLRPEWENLMAAMQAAYERRFWQTVIDFTQALDAAWYARGRFGQARQGLRWAYAAATRLEEEEGMAAVLLRWGKAALEQRDHAEARQHLEQSRHLYTELKDWAGLSDCLCALARIDLEQSRYDAAAHLLAESRRLRQALNDEAGVAETRYVEARLDYFRGRYAGAQALAEMALRAQEQQGDRLTSIYTLSLLASIAIQQGSLERAEAHAQRALALCDEIDDVSDKSILLDVLADIYRRRRQFAAAETYARDSLNLLQRIGDLGSQAQVLYQLSRIYKDQALYEQARNWGIQSLNLCESLHYSVLEAFVLINLGEIEHALGQKEPARERLQKAYAIGRQLDHSYLMTASQKKLASLNMGH